MYFYDYYIFIAQYQTKIKYMLHMAGYGNVHPHDLVVQLMTYAHSYVLLCFDMVNGWITKKLKC